MNRDEIITVLRRFALARLERGGVALPVNVQAARTWDPPREVVDAIQHPDAVAPRVDPPPPRWGISPERTPMSTPPSRPGAYLIGVPSRWFPWSVPQLWSRWVEGLGFRGVYDTREQALADPRPEDAAEQSPAFWRDVIVG